MLEKYLLANIFCHSLVFAPYRKSAPLASVLSVAYYYNSLLVKSPEYVPTIYFRIVSGKTTINPVARNRGGQKLSYTERGRRDLRGVSVLLPNIG